jgi:hypothetical protein
MKKYFINSGYFHENKWVDENNKECSVPKFDDDIILDERCVLVKFKFKTRFGWFYKLIYNLKNLIKSKSFIYWNSLSYRTITINCSNGEVIFGLPLKSSIITFERGTITVNKDITCDSFQRPKNPMTFIKD